MVTYFVGVEEVTAYLRDLLDRLDALDPFPNLWCPVTTSGNVLVERLVKLVEKERPKWIDKISVIPIRLAKGGSALRFDCPSPARHIAGKNVLLLDAAIHSGSTMSRSAARVVEMGASHVCAYTLMLRSDSAFIPTMWGFMIGRTDRAFFLLDKVPNHRLSAEANGRPRWTRLERLSKEHVQKPPVVSGVKSMDRATWEDRWFDMVTGGQGRASYLFLGGDQVLGYLTIHGPEDGRLTIDEVVLGEKWRGQHLGGVLVRFAETVARQSDCKFLRLHALSHRVRWYKGLGFRPLSGKPIRLEEETYFPMERAILHAPIEVRPLSLDREAFLVTGL